MIWLPRIGAVVSLGARASLPAERSGEREYPTRPSTSHRSLPHLDVRALTGAQRAKMPALPANYRPRSMISVRRVFAWFIASSGESSPLLAFERKMPNVFSISFQSGVRGRGRELSSERSCAGYEGNLATSSGSVNKDLRVGGL